MDELTFFIGYRFPSLNDVINAARTHWSKSARMKKDCTEVAAITAKAAANARGWECTDDPVELIFTWYEPNKKRDQDNITSAEKFVLDGIVKAGLIPDDSRKYVPFASTHWVETSNREAGVKVTIRKIK